VINVNAAATKAYHARIQRVLQHIDRHLEDDLSLEALSDVAAFSKFHFQRQFTDLLGISVHHYVQLVRLKRATYRLAFRDDIPVIEIALAAGYEAPEAFARAFKQVLGQTPSGFRKQPDWDPWHNAYQPVSETRNRYMRKPQPAPQVEIVTVTAIPVAVLEHRGDPALIGQSIRHFIAWRKAAGLSPRHSATFNILYDNPWTTPPADFRLDLCVATDRCLTPEDAGIVAKVIPAGRCATLRHVGSEEEFAAALSSLYADWLPESGEELRDFPLYCQRIIFFPDVPERESITDIFVPLK
jgi:AraC family transcriptional regulator